MDKKEAFHALYALYIAEYGLTDQLPSEADLQASGEKGVYDLLSKMYKNPPTGAASALIMVEEAESDPAAFESRVGGLSDQICRLASTLLDRTVGRQDFQVVAHFTAEKLTLSNEAFDNLTKLLEEGGKPNAKLTELMSRPSRFKQSTGLLSHLPMSQDKLTLTLAAEPEPSPKEEQTSGKALALSFMDEGQDWVLTIHESRYGSAVVALIAPVDMVEEAVGSIENQNGESQYELWGLSDTWYPVGRGRTIAAALANLDRFLAKNQDDWKIIGWGLETLNTMVSDKDPFISVEYRDVCKLDDLGALRAAYDQWNEGIEPKFF